MLFIVTRRLKKIFNAIISITFKNIYKINILIFNKVFTGKFYRVNLKLNYWQHLSWTFNYRIDNFYGEFLILFLTAKQNDVSTTSLINQNILTEHLKKVIYALILQ